MCEAPSISFTGSRILRSVMCSTLPSRSAFESLSAVPFTLETWLFNFRGPRGYLSAPLALGRDLPDRQLDFRRAFARSRR